MNNGILIWAEITRENYVHPVTFELASKAGELSEKKNNIPVTALVCLTEELSEDFKEVFCSNGFDKVFYIKSEKFKIYKSDLFTKAVISAVQSICPEIMLIGATCQGRDLAPRISSSLHTGLTADCIDLDINEKGQLAATRPTFGGELMATILCKNYPQMATVRPNVFKVHSVDYYADTEFIKNDTSILDGIKNHVEILEFKKTLENEINDLDNADIIVAGGMGLKNEKGFELLRKFADKVGGIVAATRPAVENGLAPHSIQIGQTGKTVRPKIYIACGISGAIQHTVGMDKSSHIVAINNDPDAPIFNIADTGIVGDFFEIASKYLEL